MIIKGKSRAGPTALAAHLGNAEKNERVTLLETKGMVATDLRGALVEMDAYAVGTRCEKSLYHAAMSPEPPHRLTPDQRAEAIDALEEKLGLSGHARVVVMHEKLGREHIHVVWSRIDLGTMKSVSDSHNYRKHEEVARDLERRFGHERVQGAHHEREGVERPDRTPSRAELRQEERTGIKGQDVKGEVTAAFRASDTPQAFQSALEDKGYILAQGDRRDFVVVDRAGGIHSLARRIDGMKAAELREFMSPIDREALPNPQAAREIAEDRKRQKEAHQQASLEAAYARGDGYTQQSDAALKDHQRRQHKLDRPSKRDSTWDRIQRGEKAPDSKGTVERVSRTDEERISRILGDGGRDRRNNPGLERPSMNGSPEELSHDNMVLDAWNVVFMRLPQNTDQAFRNAAHGIAEHCFEAALDQALGAPGYQAFNPSKSQHRDRGDDAAMARAALSRMEELEKIDPTLERVGPYHTGQRSEDEERIAQILDDIDRDRRTSDERPTERKSDDRVSDAFANTEMTEAQQQRMDRMLGEDGGERAHSSERDDIEPDRQREAPGGGHTRGR